MTDLEVIAQILHLTEDEALDILELCRWADHEVAIATHGYPKDNLLAPPMHERMTDLDYVRRLQALADEDEEISARCAQAIRDRAQALADFSNEQ